MRFFKAFNILHRRTKSATFVSGPSVDHLASTTRRCSASYGQLPASQKNGIVTTSTIFDMVISRVPSSSPQFIHLADSTTLSSWYPRRQSGRTSLASVHSSIDKEHSRLKDAVIFWSQEHSKLRTILHNCHADLVAERRKNLVLERRAELDTHIIKDLRRRLTQDDTLSRKTEILHGSHSSEQEAHSGDPAVAITSTSTETLSPASSPLKLPTIEEYSNALRLTLATRKELRDQKKVSKFWKRKTSVMDKDQQNNITPSISTISSVHENIPVERQAALQALIMRRGLGSRLAELVKSPLSNDSCAEVSSEFAVELSSSSETVPPITVSNLPPSFSKCSVDSRLPPLASESMKAEINLMFGSRDSSKLLFSLSQKGRGRSGSISMQKTSKKPTSGKASSLESHHPNSTVAESFSSGLNTLPESETEATIEADNVVVNYPAHQAVEFDHHEAYDLPFSQGLPSWSSSIMQISALPSGTSQTFGQEFSSASHLQNSNTIIPNPSMKQASKECTPRRSFYHYTLTKSGKPNGPIGGVVQSPVKQTITKTGTKEKENNQISKTLPVHQKGHSRLPVPSFTRNGG